jgi:hypothetical protein
VAFDLDDAGGIELDFAGTEYEGLTVRMRPTSIGGLLDLAETAEQLEGLQDGMSPADLKKRIRGVLDPLAGLLAGWDLTRGGEQVPADTEGLLSVPPALLSRIISAYVAAQAQADPKPPSASSGGETSDQVEASIPMSPQS